MAKFSYKMQNILNIKYKLEEQAKSDFSLAMNRLKKEEEELQKIKDDIIKYQDIIRENGNGSINVRELLQCTNAIEIKKEQMKVQEKKISAARINVEKAREKLNEVMIDRKTHEILKEKAFDEFKQEIMQQENKEIDELISFRGNNKQ